MDAKLPEWLQVVTDEDEIRKAYELAEKLCKSGTKMPVWVGLEKAEGRKRVIHLLKHGDVQERMSILHDLNWTLKLYQNVPFFLHDKELHEAVLGQLQETDEDIVCKAVGVCNELKISEARKYVLDIFSKCNTSKKKLIAKDISSLKTDMGTMEVMCQWLSSGNEIKKDQYFYVMKAFLEDPVTRNFANDVLLPLVNELLCREEPPDWFGGDGYLVQSTINIMLRRNGITDLAQLYALLEKPFLKGCRAEVIAAIYRENQEQGKHLFLKELKEKRVNSELVGILGEIYEISPDPGIVEGMIESMQGLYDYEIAKTLWRLGMYKAKKAAIDMVPKLSGWRRTNLIWDIQGWTLETVRDRVIESGVLDAKTYDEILKMIRKDYELGLRDYQNELDLMYLFVSAGIGLWYDCEAVFNPCLHDDLVREYAAASNNEFLPEAVTEQFFKENAEYGEVAYTLQFVFAGRLYRAELEYLRDYYDGYRVVTTINQALSDAGNPKRFVYLGDCAEEQVFAVPENLEKLAKQLYLPYGRDRQGDKQKAEDFVAMATAMLDNGQLN